VRIVPFLAIHASCLLVLWVGWSPIAVTVAVSLYLARMFAVTGFYHRYFSHRSFKTSRLTQLCFAVLGASACQRGPIWWASWHRHHHTTADSEADLHSPRQKGFWTAHCGWFLTRRAFRPQTSRVSDMLAHPELVVLDRFAVVVPIVLGVTLFGLGALLEATAPGLATDGPQMFVWGFSISTVALFHATFCVNSLGHLIGSRRFDTRDDSKNSWLIALITLGEGWHNNHHRHPSATRAGLRWWELDPTYRMLQVLAALGVIWDLNAGPSRRESRALGRAA